MSGSWLEGTMDVIANVSGNESRRAARSPSPAPRPDRSRAAAAGAASPALRSARSFSPAPSARVPSKDAMDRSIHNESTHGKSTAQIIRDLRAANASLTSKTADMEADFMNQCSSLSNQIKTLNEQLQRKDQQIQQYESRAASAEKLREEAEFSKHTVADLKSQLYQLQNEIEEAEYDKQEEVDFVKNEASANERVYRDKIAELEKDLEDLRAEGAGTSVDENGMSGRHVSDSDIDAYESEITHLKQKLSEERGGTDQLEAVKKEKEREVGELRSMLRARDDTISSLQVKVGNYTEEITALESENDKLRSAFDKDDERNEAQEELERERQLRRQQEEEVAELRETIDGQAETVKELTKDLEEQIDTNAAMTKEIVDLRKLVKELESRGEVGGAEAESYRAKLEEAEATIASLRRDNDGAQKRRIAQLEQERNEAESELDAVRSELAEVRERASQDRSAAAAAGEEESEKLSLLRKEVEDVTRERTTMEGELTKKLTAVKSANLQAVTKLEVLLHEKEDEVERQRSEFELERTELKSSIDGYVQEKAELEAEITTLKNDVKAVEKSKGSSSAADVKDLKKQLRQAQVALVALDNEKLKEKKKFIASLEEAKSDLATAQQTLADAEASHRVAIESLEMEKEEIKAEFVKNIGDKDETIKELRAAVSGQEERVADLVSEVDSLQIQLDKAAELSRASGELEKELESTKSALSALEATLAERESELHLAKKQTNSARSVAPSATDFPDDEAGNLPDRIKALEAEKRSVENELKAKLEDRDTTISALVKSSARAEQNLSKLKTEIMVLQEQVKQGTDGSNEELERLRNMEAVKSARNAKLKDEIESIRETLDGYKTAEDQLSKEVSMLKHELSVAEAEVARLRSRSPGSSGANELLKQISGLQEERALIEEDHREKIVERDAAISKLVKSSLSQEQQITSLQKEVETLRKNKSGGGSSGGTRDGPSWEEMHRLQQESEIFAGQIIEQDEEMEGLRVELEKQERKNTELLKEVSDLKTKPRGGGIEQSKIADMQAHLDEVQEANKEYREELKELRRKLRHSQADADRVADLEVQLREAQSSLSDAKSRSAGHFQEDEMVVEDLREQLEKALESKAVVEAELRKQRRTAMEGGKSSKMEDELRQDLEEAISSKEVVEERLTKQIESLRKLKDSAKHDFEAQLRERDEEISSLKEEAAQQEGVLASLRREVEEVRSSLDEKSELAEASQKEADELRSSLHEQTQLTRKERTNATAEFDDEMKSVSLDNQSLAKKVESLEAELKSLENGSSDIRDLRKRLKVAEEDRAKVEKKIASTYERKMTLMQTEKDMEIDGLRKELTASKEKLSGLEQERASLMKKLESSNVEIQEELEERLHHKNAKIMALEQTLAAQEQVLGNMQAEMDQLQSGMDKVSLTRRAEIEEMEQELMESAQKATKYEREMAVLKDRLEDYKLRHNTEVAKLQERIFQLEKESPMERSVREQRDDHKVQELNEKIDQLKWRLTGLQEDNQKLREKLEKHQDTAHHKRNSSTDRWRNAALQEQVALLSQKNKDLEKHIGSASSAFGHSSLSTIETKHTRTSSIDANTPSIIQSASFDAPPSPVKSASAAANGTRSSSTGRALSKTRELGQSVRGESLTPSKFERPRTAASPSRIRASLGAASPSSRMFHRRNRSRDAGATKSFKDHLRVPGKKSGKETDDQVSTHTEMTF